jgi:2,3-bisphosphoglycerate-independent phosphoglycerate mutase
MDRDRRWERTERAWKAMALGEADAVADDVGFIADRYRMNETDEFLDPTVLPAGADGIGEDDAVLFLNFRADRMRQLVASLTDPAFDAFLRARPVVADVVTMTEYTPELPVRVAFPPKVIENGLGAVISGAGLRQRRVAETEKYAHVTYFFNGGEETPLEGESRALVPSPRVATYDLQPEMSAAGVADAVLEALDDPGIAFVLVNFANPDMVGHTGVIPAAVAAVEAVDEQLGRLLDRVGAGTEWVALVTADHGNCETMLTPEGRPHTAHTTEPVDFAVFDPSGATRALRADGRLADVAPTVLGYLGLPVPDEMTGTSLVEEA